MSTRRNRTHPRTGQHKTLKGMGLTLAAAKAGMATVPPLFFAGTRFLAAGILIVAYLMVRGEWVRFGRRETIRLIIVSLLMVTLTYGLLFWGMLFVNSGTAALLEMSFTPQPSPHF